MRCYPRVFPAGRRSSALRSLGMGWAMTASLLLNTGCQPQRLPDHGLRGARLNAPLAHHVPVAVEPALGIIHDDPTDNPDGFVALSVTGLAFGSVHAGSMRECGWPGSGSFLELYSGATVRSISSADRRVVSWTDVQIVVKLASSNWPSRVRVCTPGGAGTRIEAMYYTYDHFAVPQTTGTNPHPLALATDAARRVWIDEEFHLEFKYFDPTTASFTALDIPKPADPGPFALTGFDDHRTQISGGGEAVTVDPLGRVWFTQGGSVPYGGIHPNHSRVVCFDPAAAAGQEFRVYNVPGNQNGVVGVAWDERRQRVWFTEVAQSGLHGARLVSFDPEHIAFDNHFDFSTTATCSANPTVNQPGWCSNSSWRACLTPQDCVLAEQICPPGATDDSSCYHEYEMPPLAGTYMPGHVAVHPDGSVWYTSYWSGNYIGRLDPDSASFATFPLPDPRWKPYCSDTHCACFPPPTDAVCLYCCQVLFFGSGPWEIDVAGNHDVVFTEFFNSSVGRFHIADLGDPACHSLDESGKNPCIQELVVPRSDLPVEQVHSIAFDGDGNVWFTESGPFSDPGSSASLGYVKQDWSALVLLPPLSLYPFYNSTGNYCPTAPGAFVSFNGAGIAIDPATQDIWFADYCRKRLGRLRRLAR